MIPFCLEDFFDEYEHCSEFFNLASSDAAPWNIGYLKGKGISFSEDASFVLRYPDVKVHLLPALLRFCQPPAGMGLLPTSGAAEAIALIMHEFSDRSVRENRPIGIPAPAYGAFSGLAALLRLPTETYTYCPSQGWAPDFDKVFDLCKRCGALVVINPHNPTGRLMPADVLRRVAQELASRDAILIVDEVFRVSSKSCSAIDLGPNVVLIGSLSKTYGLPGLRLGWVSANEGRLKRLRTVQQNLTLALNAITVAFGAAILDQPEHFSRANLIRDNRRILIDWANAQSGFVSISPPQGGTTVCLTINAAHDEAELFRRFLQHRVLLAPGSRCFEFGRDIRWFRLGYGAESDTFRRGLECITAVITTLAGS